MLSGRLPDNELMDKYSTDSNVRCTISAGIMLVKIFEDSCSVSSLDNILTDEGIEPEK